MKHTLMIIITILMVISCEKKEVPRVTSITLNLEEIKLKVGEEYQFSVSHTPEEAPKPEYHWLVEDAFQFWESPKTIAEIDQEGKLKALKKGETLVQVRTTNVGDVNGIAFYSRCKLMIENIEETGIKLNKNELSLNVGRSEALTYKIEPENTTVKDVNWYSDDNDVATVTNGVVQGQKDGNTVIYIRTSLGKTDSCKVTVSSVNIAAIKLNKNELNLNVGYSETLTYRVEPENATIKDLNWYSNDPEVATVTNGVIQGKKEGNTVIGIRTSLGKADSCKVTVGSIKVTSIKLNETRKEVNYKDGFKLEHTIIPEESTNKHVTWHSSDKSIAIVDKNGVVQTCGVGECEIKVRSEDGGFEAICQVVVNPVRVTGISLDTKYEEVFVGDLLRLFPKLYPANCSNYSVSWSSSNPNVAVYWETYLVRAIGVGECDIKVKSDDGGFEAVCRVVVKPKKLTGIKLKAEHAVFKGENFVLTPEFIPANATNKNVTWSSSDPGIATVDKSGLINAVKDGQCNITVRSEDGGFEAVCRLNVLPLRVTGVRIAPSSLKIGLEESKQLQAIISPVNAENKKIKWSSSNPTIASVNENGVVYSNSYGTVRIKVETEDGGYQSECYVEVVSVDRLVDSYFPSTSLVVVNGYLTGTVNSKLVNGSSKTIQVTKFTVKEGSNIIFEAMNVAKELGPNQTIDTGVRLNNVFDPTFIWEYTYDGQLYSVSKKYTKD